MNSPFLLLLFSQIEGIKRKITTRVMPVRIICDNSGTEGGNNNNKNIESKSNNRDI